jgi:hypothetical protein
MADLQATRTRFRLRTAPDCSACGDTGDLWLCPACGWTSPDPQAAVQGVYVLRCPVVGCGVGVDVVECLDCRDRVGAHGDA